MPRAGSGGLDSTPVRGCFFVDHGSLCAALQRLEEETVDPGEVRCEQLAEKTGEWRRLTRAMSLVLDANHGPQNEEA